MPGDTPKDRGLRARVRTFRMKCMDPDENSATQRRDIAALERSVLSRRLSIWITYCLRNTPVSPNQVTVCWVLLGVAGASMLAVNTFSVSVAAVVVLYIAWLLDNVDGELARFRKQFSTIGNFVDMVGHQLVFPLIFGALTVALVSDGAGPVWIMMGISATVFTSPVTKMGEQVMLIHALALIAAYRRGVVPGAVPVPVPEDSRPVARPTLSSLLQDGIGVVFTHTGILYLLILAVLCDARYGFVALYGIGMPAIILPKLVLKVRAIGAVAGDPSELEQRIEARTLQ